MKMSDDAMEAALRRVRPAALPLELAERMERPAVVRRRVVPFVGIGLAAAVAIAAGGLIWQGVSRGPGETGGASLIHAQQRTVKGVRPLGVVEDAERNHWRLMEVAWEEEEAVVSVTGGTVVHSVQPRRAVVPVFMPLD
jgi:hypothetical protein